MDAETVHGMIEFRSSGRWNSFTSLWHYDIEPAFYELELKITKKRKFGEK